MPTAQATTQIRAAIVGLQKAGSLNGTKTFQENMQDLYDTVNGNQKVLLKEVGSIEAVQAILATAGKNAQSANDDLLSYNDTIGATRKAFQKMASSNVNQWEILGNRIKATTSGIGDAVLDISSKFAKGLNDILEPTDAVVMSLQKERIELLTLESVIKDTNTSNEDRIKIIQELKDRYPGLLANIDAETISNEELSLSIKKINEQLINKLVLAEKEVEIQNQNQDTKERLLALIEQEEKVREQLVELADKEGKVLKDNASLIEQSRDLLRQFSKEEKQGGRLTNPLVEFSHQVSELKTAQDNLNNQEERGAKLIEEKIKLAERLGIVLDQNSKKTVPKESSEVKIKPIDETSKKDTTFANFLKEKEKQFEEYALAIKQNDLELSEELKAQYKIKEDDYVQYLRNLYDKTESNKAKLDILKQIESQGSVLKRPIVEAISQIKPKPIQVPVELDTTSINSINARIDGLYSDFDAARTEFERKGIAEKIIAEELKLQAARKSLHGENSLHELLNKNISNLRNKDLKEYIKSLKIKKAELEKAGLDSSNVTDAIEDTKEKIGEDLAESFGQISGILREASALFQKFGDEDIAKLLDQLAGVGDGIATIAASGGDPLAIAQGALQVLNSALTVEIVSDTEKFEAVIKDLEKAIEKLDFVISRSVGADKIENRLEAIEDLKDLEEQAEKARQAELDARKEIRLLGITIGNKGRGSGTDPAKLEELEQKAEDARRKVEELRDQLNELYTGTTENTIVDSIISGLKEGKKSVSDFAEDFKDLMQNAMLQAFQIKYLEKEIEKFYDAFALAGSDSSYSAAEINALRDLYGTIISGAQDDIDAINQILEQTGIGALGSGATDGANSPNGLTGAIRRELTEETASELTGLFRNQLEHARQHLDISTRNLTNTSRIADISETIADNTFNTVEELKKVNSRLDQVVTNTEKEYTD